MSRRDKIGLTILLGLFATFFALLRWTVTPHGEPHSPEDSVFVKTRMKHLENNR
jgi:hypothetical protein